jgi:hypothetical protein
MARMAPRPPRSVPLRALAVLAALPLLTAQAIPFTHQVIDRNQPTDPDCKTIADLDGDGLPDVIVASGNSGGMYWYRAPAWSKHAIRATGSWTTDMQAGDIDRDGDADLVIPDATGLLWYRNPLPTGNPRNGSEWIAFHIGAPGANNHDLELGDMNGDGRLDAVSRQYQGGATHVWLQGSPTSWTRVTASTQPGEGTGLGDIDNDGDLDILHNGFWAENNGAGTAWTHRPIAAGWPPDVGAVVADIDKDGRNDVVLAPAESSGRLSWYESAAPRTGPWTEHVIDGTVSYFHTFKAADVDRDGDLDLVTAEMHQSTDPDEVSVYRNGGDGLSWVQQVVAGTGSHNIRVGDIDGDDDLDLMGTNWSDSAPDGADVNLWRNGLRGIAASAPVGYPSDTARAAGASPIPLGFASAPGFDEARWQQLVPAKHLPSTGGAITRLAASCQSGAALRYSSLRITLSHTSATSLGSSFSGNLPSPQLVLGATDHTVQWSAGDRVEIRFTTPFVYDGASSLVVSIQKAYDRTTHPLPGAVAHQTAGPPSRADLVPAAYAASSFGGGGSTTDIVAATSAEVLALRFLCAVHGAMTVASLQQPSGREFSIGTNARLVIWAAPGTTWGTLLDTAFHAPVAVPPLQGRLFVQPNLLVASGTTEGGSSGLTFGIPRDPALVGSYWVLQSATMDPGRTRAAFTNAVDLFVNQ